MSKSNKIKPKIAFLFPRLIKSAPITYNKNLIDHLGNEFDITVFYFQGENIIGFTCKTQKIDESKCFYFEGFDLIPRIACLKYILFITKGDDWV